MTKGTVYLVCGVDRSSVYHLHSDCPAITARTGELGITVKAKLMGDGSQVIGRGLSKGVHHRRACKRCLSRQPAPLA